MTPEVRAWLHDLLHRDRASAVLLGQAIGLLVEAGPDAAGDGRPHPHTGPKISDDHPYNEPVRLSRRRQPGAGVTLAHSWLSTLAAYPLITQP